MITLKIKTYRRRDMEVLYDTLLNAAMRCNATHPDSKMVIDDLQRALDYLDTEIQSTELPTAIKGG